MSATVRKEKMAELRIENNDLRQTAYSLTRLNAELLERADELKSKLDCLDSLLENISLWMYKQQGNPLPQWADEFHAVCQMMEPK